MIECTEVEHDGHLLETIQENAHMNHVWQIPVSWSFFYMSNEKTAGSSILPSFLGIKKTHDKDPYSKHINKIIKIVFFFVARMNKRVVRRLVKVVSGNHSLHGASLLNTTLEK